MKLTCSLRTVMPADTFRVWQADVEEGLSSLFSIKVVCTSKDAGLDPGKLLEKSAVLSLDDGAIKRFFHGWVTHFSESLHKPFGVETPEIQSLDDAVAYYTFVIRPQTWRMLLSQTCQIFQNKSALDIIKDVLKKHGIQDLEDHVVQAGKTVREYCVQYNETPWHFVSRLMEEEGIFYFFKHSENKHVMVLADHSKAYQSSMPSSLNFRAMREPSGLVHVVSSCVWGQHLTSQHYESTDYNFTTPSAVMKVESGANQPEHSIYEYPGFYDKRPDGQKYADIRQQAQVCEAQGVHATSTAYGVTPGFTISLKDYPQSARNKTYAVVRVKHQIRMFQTQGALYQNTWEGIPDATTFRPERVTARPLIHGTQTAVVTGPSGEDIHMDKWGRIKVRFHWDPSHPKDDKSSCWIRVSQTWSGRQWGAQYIPRMGQEVVITYLEGNPDRPLVTGTVYNGEHPIPYGPDQKTKSTLKSADSSPKGEGFHEIRFEDKKDKEELYVYAHRDYNTVVQNGSRTATLKAAEGKAVKDELTIVKGDRITTFQEGDETHTLTKGNQTISLESGERSIDVKGGDENHSNDQNFTHKVKKNYTLKIDGNLEIDVTGNITIKSGQKIQVKSGMDTDFNAGMNFKVQSGMNTMYKAGMNFQVQGGIAVMLQGGAQFMAQGGGMAMVKGGGSAMVSAPAVLLGG